MDEQFDAKAQSFSQIMDSQQKLAYVVPLYQRRYIWGKDENNRLWDDVASLIDDPDRTYFLGSVVLMDYDGASFAGQPENLKKEGMKLYSVVDGQQRLTSLSLLVQAIRSDMEDIDDCVRKVFEEETDPARKKHLKKLWEGIKRDLENMLLTDEIDMSATNDYTYIPRLIPGQNSYAAYREIMNMQPAPDARIRICKMYNLYKDRVVTARRESLKAEYGAEGTVIRFACQDSDILGFYERFKDIITKQLQFVRVKCGKDEDAFQVFESLNGTGVKLSFSDRIKNILMGQAVTKEQRSSTGIDKLWIQIEETVNGGEMPSNGNTSEMERFLLSYLFVFFKRRVARKDATAKFQEMCSSFSNTNKVLEEMQRMAEYYRLIVHKTASSSSQSAPSLSPSTKSLIEGITVNSPRQGVVPLLALAKHYGLKETKRNNTDVDKICRALLTLFVRHNVCNMPTNVIDRFSESYCKLMAEKKTDELLETIRRDCQSDSKFLHAFEDMTFDSKQLDMRRARYYLLTIENYLHTQQSVAELPEDDYSLEHIIPQSFKPDKWFKDDPSVLSEFDDDENYTAYYEDDVIMSIGNMCILRSEENSGAGNATYNNKLLSYKKAYAPNNGSTASGTFILIKQLLDNEVTVNGDPLPIVAPDSATFDAASVEKRAKALAEYAVKIWC